MKLFSSLVLPLLESVSAHPYPLDYLIITQGFWLVNYFFIFFRIFLPSFVALALPCTIILSKIFKICNVQDHQNFRKRFVQFFLKKCLTKMCGRWYNGNFGEIVHNFAPHSCNKKDTRQSECLERGECITRSQQSQSPRPPQSNEQCSSP